MGYLLTPGASGDFAGTADGAVTPVTGDLDVRVDVAVDDYTTAAQQSLFAHNSTASGLQGWALALTVNGNLRLVHSASGESAIGNNSTVTLGSVGIVDGQRVQLRATFDVDNETAGWTKTFYYRTDGSLADAGWTQLGDPGVAGGGATSINATTAGVVIARNRSNAAQFETAGKFYRCQFFAGINGTLRFDADFTDEATWAQDKGSVTEKANDATVTLAGDAELVADAPLPDPPTSGGRALLMGV